MSAEGIIIKHFMIILEYTYIVHASTVHHNFWTAQVVWSRLKSTCRCQVKSSRMCSSRPPSTWGHFSLKSGHVSLPQRLTGLLILGPSF